MIDDLVGLRNSNVLHIHAGIVKYDAFIIMHYVSRLYLTESKNKYIIYTLSDKYARLEVRTKKFLLTLHV